MKRATSSGTAYGSIYSVPEDAAPGSDACVYGRFMGQQILGKRCTITCERLEDGDPRAVDILGYALRRGRVAIHISGKDDFGQRTGPGFVREMALYSVDWLGHEEDRCSGLGCAEPEAAAIVTSDDNHRRPERYRHHCFYSGTDGFVSFDGIWQWWWSGERRDVNALLTPRLVCEEMDRRHERSWTYVELQHLRAVGRLLEGMVGVNNHAAGAIAPDLNRLAMTATLRRGRQPNGKLYYRWEMPVTCEVEPVIASRCSPGGGGRAVKWRRKEER